MAKTANKHFLEELYDLSVANALLIDEETGLELYSVCLVPDLSGKALRFSPLNMMWEFPLWRSG